MKLIKPQVEIWTPKSYSLEDGFRHAERCGRICYLSNDKITDDSYKKFCGNIIKSGHTSVMEHMTVYMTIPIGSPVYDPYYMGKHELVELFNNNPYSFVKHSPNYNIVAETPEEYKHYVEHLGPTTIYYITTNYRVILDNKNKLKWAKHPLDEVILPYITTTPDFKGKHVERVTVHWTISRAIADEFARHRVLSHSMQSTRYCNYSKDKFGNELTYVLHSDMLDLPEGKYEYGSNNSLQSGWYVDDTLAVPFEATELILPEDARVCWLSLLQAAENAYMRALECGWKPQQARGILPLDIKTEFVQTGTVDQWTGFMLLRSHLTGASGMHPDADYIASELYKLLFYNKVENKTYDLTKDGNN